MDESLIERRRVQDEGLRVVNCFSRGESRKTDSTLGIRGCKLRERHKQHCVLSD